MAQQVKKQLGADRYMITFWGRRVGKHKLVGR